MTPQELIQHPYWARFNARFTACVNQLLQTGQMMQPESQVIGQLLSRVGPAVQQFVQGLIYRYATTPCSDQQLDTEIMTNFMPQIRTAAQQQLQAMMQQQNQQYRMGCMQPQFGGMPQYGMQQQMGGFYPQQPTPSIASMSNATAGASMFAPSQPGGAGSFAALGKAPPPDIKPEEPKPKTPVATWKPPELLDSKSARITDAVDIRIGKFNLSGDLIGRRAAVVDNRIRYTNDHEALDAFKSIFDMYKSDKQFLTVAYKQLKVVRANREEFTRLSNAVSAAVHKNSSTLESKIRAILNTIRTTYSLSCVTEFTNLFLGEIDAVQECGRFVPSSAPQALFNLTSIEQVLSIVTGELDKASSDAMKSIPGLIESFSEVVENVIDYIITKLPQLILDPTKDLSTLDDYSRALPAVWTPDDGLSVRGTDDLFDLFLMTRETISGSKSDGATRAEGELRTRIAELDNSFCIVTLHRVASWCNYPTSEVITYTANGSHTPTVFDPSKPFNDPTFFIAEFLQTAAQSKITTMARAPKKIYFEFEEGTLVHNYGYTNDNHVWIANPKFWR